MAAKRPIRCSLIPKACKDGKMSQGSQWVACRKCVKILANDLAPRDPVRVRDWAPRNPQSDVWS